MRSVRLSAALVLILALGALSPAWAQVSEPEPFFSEYVEGADGKRQSRGDFDDALELFNPTAAAFNLQTYGCAILLYVNGATPATSLPLTGVIDAGGTMVLISDLATDPSLIALLSDPGVNAAQLTGLSFDGDDALELVCTSLPARADRDIILDVIGIPGDTNGPWTDPISGLSTANFVLQKIPPDDPWGSILFSWEDWSGSDSSSYNYGELGDFVPVELLSFSVE